MYQKYALISVMYQKSITMRYVAECIVVYRFLSEKWFFLIFSVYKALQA